MLDVPSFSAWLSEPLKIIDDHFDEYGSDNIISGVESSLRNFIKNQELRNMIPHFRFSSSTLSSGRLVQFQGMVQDIGNPDYYAACYPGIGGKMKCGAFRGTTDLSEEETDISSRNIRLKTRYVYEMTVPPELEWVKEMNIAAQRSDDDGRDDGLAVKRAKKDEHFTLDAIRTVRVRFYWEDDGVSHLTLNDLAWMVGVLSWEMSSPLQDFDAISQAFISGKNLTSPPIVPQNVIPTIECICFERLVHLNPLVPQPSVLDDRTFSDSNVVSIALGQDILRIREQCLQTLRECFLGDVCASEYVLLCILSRVFSKPGCMPLGQLNLNVSGLKQGSNIPKFFLQLMEQLLSSFCYVPLSLSNLNEKSFVPSKDKDGIMSYAILQLPADVLLILNECELLPGNLNETGLRNVASLRSLLQTQRLSYSFPFHIQEFDAYFPALVFSEGSSMIHTELNLPLNSTQDEPLHMPVINHEDLLKIRTYLTLTRYLPYKIESDLEKVIEEDFVKMRQPVEFGSEPGCSPSQLHTLLSLARVMSLSRGETSLGLETWERVKNLETQRKARIAQLQGSLSDREV